MLQMLYEPHSQSMSRTNLQPRVPCQGSSISHRFAHQLLSVWAQLERGDREVGAATPVQPKTCTTTHHSLTAPVCAMWQWLQTRKEWHCSSKPIQKEQGRAMRHGLVGTIVCCLCGFSTCMLFSGRLPSCVRKMASENALISHHLIRSYTKQC
jgi:hypothetical protein